MSFRLWSGGYVVDDEEQLRLSDVPSSTDWDEGRAAIFGFVGDPAEDSTSSYLTIALGM